VSVIAQEMTKATESRIPCSRSTRRLVKAQKLGGESYDTLLQEMVAQYDPEERVDEREQS
jgi:hypothetical protein